MVFSLRGYISFPLLRVDKEGAVIHIIRNPRAKKLSRNGHAIRNLSQHFIYPRGPPRDRKKFLPLS